MWCLNEEEVWSTDVSYRINERYMIPLDVSDRMAPGTQLYVKNEHLNLRIFITVTYSWKKSNPVESYFMIQRKEKKNKNNSEISFFDLENFGFFFSNFFFTQNRWQLLQKKKKNEKKNPKFSQSKKIFSKRKKKKNFCFFFFRAWTNTL